MPTIRSLTTKLAVEDSAELPTEFRLFVSGWNDTENGQYLFDSDAAASVMAAYEKWGVELAIDVEHQMLDGASADPTARDARGWFKLELRDDGSLWAVNVRWTTDGASRLSEKRQRYISPAFEIDPKTKRVTKIINAAITSIPATHDTPALVAASAQPRDVRKLSTGPAFADVTGAIGVALGELYPPPSDGMCVDGPWIQDVFDASVVFVLQGEFFEAPYTFDGAKATLGAPVKVTRSYAPVDPAPAAATEAAARRDNTDKVLAALAAAEGSGMDPKLIAQALDALIAGDAEKCQEILKGLVASAAGAEPEAEAEAEPEAPPAGEPPPEAQSGGTPPESEEQAAASAAVAQLTRVTQRASLAAALDEVEVWRLSHVRLQEQEAKFAEERAAIELNHRKENAKKLCALGAETPNTSGLASFANGAKGSLAKRLMDEPLAEQDKRIAELLASKGGKLPANPKPPTPTVTKVAQPTAQTFVIEGVTIELTADEVAMCTRKKIDLEKYAKTRAAMKARSHNQSNGA